jgi:hypothetical protein
MGGLAAPASHPLTDAWLRVDWADMHGHLFADRSVEFLRTEPYRLWAEWNGARWEVRFHSRTDPKAELLALTELARPLGAFLDHARAALNYTAYQVALLAVRDDPSLLKPPTDGGKPFRPESVEFPIYNWEKLYRKGQSAQEAPAEVHPRHRSRPAVSRRQRSALDPPRAGRAISTPPRASGDRLARR